jgi:hypothetical protein
MLPAQFVSLAYMVGIVGITAIVFSAIMRFTAAGGF